MVRVLPPFRYLKRLYLKDGGKLLCEAFQLGIGAGNGNVRAGFYQAQNLDHGVFRNADAARCGLAL